MKFNLTKFKELKLNDGSKFRKNEGSEDLPKFTYSIKGAFVECMEEWPDRKRLETLPPSKTNKYGPVTDFNELTRRLTDLNSDLKDRQPKLWKTLDTLWRNEIKGEEPDNILKTKLLEALNKTNIRVYEEEQEQSEVYV